MNKTEITVLDVLGFDGKDVTQRKAQDLEVLGSMAALRERITKDAKEIRWQVVFEEVIGKIAELLDIPLGDVIARAWNKYRVLAQYLDQEKYPPSDTFLATLAEHTINSRHRPHIDVYLDDREIGRIDLEVDLTLALKGFIAKVRGGRILEIRTGTCKAKGTIKCENLLLVEKESESFELPGKIVFADGAPIE